MQWYSMPTFKKGAGLFLNLLRRIKFLLLTILRFIWAHKWRFVAYAAVFLLFWQVYLPIFRDHFLQKANLNIIGVDYDKDLFVYCSCVCDSPLFCDSGAGCDFRAWRQSEWCHKRAELLRKVCERHSLCPKTASDLLNERPNIDAIFIPPLNTNNEMISALLKVRFKNEILTMSDYIHSIQNPYFNLSNGCHIFYTPTSHHGDINLPIGTIFGYPAKSGENLYDIIRDDTLIMSTYFQEDFERDFRCFGTEEEAINAGYKKFLSNQAAKKARRVEAQKLLDTPPDGTATDMAKRLQSIDILIGL